MVTPLMSVGRSGGNRRKNVGYTPVGMTLISPSQSISPIDARMTPIRKSLFQKRRVTSSKRRNQSFLGHIEPDSRDDSNEIENLRSANKKKDGHLKLLHDRFTHIQKGLGSIDEERSQLVEKAKRLDKEKKLIQKQLELREREILTLIKRCASQEEKMRESSKLRSANRDLRDRLESTMKKLQEIEYEKQDRQSLNVMLQDSELEREQLRDRLAKVQREHDAIADTLQECLGNIRQLTEEKHAIEEERRRERKRVEIELEKQNLEHLNDSESLKENIQAHQSRIHQMEKIIQDNIKSNTALRREKAVMSQGQHEEIEEVVQKYERQLAELRNEIEDTIREKESKHDHDPKGFNEEVSLMKEKLKSKDYMIKELETEFSDQMMKLITKQSSLDEAEEERKDLELKVEASKKLEIEHAALLDLVEILDSNLAELTTANANLELEKDNLREETDELRKKANMLQKQFSSLQNNQNAKTNDFRELLNVEKEELRKELHDSLRASRSEAVALQAELKRRNEFISNLEIELNQARNLIAEKENAIVRIVKEMENFRSSLGSDLRKTRLQVSQLEAEVFAKDQTLATIQGQLQGAKEMKKVGKHYEHDDTIKIDNQRIGSTPLDTEIESLHKQLQLKDIGSEKLRSELERTVQEVRNEAMFLQQKIVSLSKEKLAMENEVEESRSLINGRDDQIVEVQQMLLKHKKRANELERKLQHTTKELKDCKEKLPSIGKSGPGDLNIDTQLQESISESNTERNVIDTATTKKSMNDNKELENRVLNLEKQLSEAQISRSESTFDLQRAHEKIEILEKQLIGEDARTESLQAQLLDTANELFEEEFKVCMMQSDHDSAAQFQLERENYEEEMRSKISILEERIEEMKKESKDMGVQIEESRRENAEKDEMISSLQADLMEGKEKTKELVSELDSKSTAMKKLELFLSENDKDIEMEMESTNASLKTKENRILELEKLLSCNEDTVENLQDSLSKAKDYITELEERICHEEEQRQILEDKLRKANEELFKTKGFDNDFLPSSDTDDLKRKIQILLSRQSDLTTQLNKTNSILEEERKSSSVKESNLYEECSILKAKILVLQNVLTERERVLSSLQKDNTDDLNQSGLSDPEHIISELEQENKLKDEKIKDLEGRKLDTNGDTIQFAFVESDKRRVEVEDELAIANKNIEELKATVDTLEERLYEVDNKLEKAIAEVAQKNQSIVSVEKRCEYLDDKATSLHEKFQAKEEQFLKLNDDFKAMRIEIEEKDRIIDNLNASTRSLQDVAVEAKNEIALKIDVMTTLAKTADQLKFDLENAKREISAKDEKINSLEVHLKAENESRTNLEDEVSVAREHMNESQQVKQDLKKQVDDRKQVIDSVEEELSQAKKALETLNQSSCEHISMLENQISKMTTDLENKDDEIRELRLVELEGAKEVSASLVKEIDSLKADALQRGLEQKSEKDSFVSQITNLKSELQVLSLEIKIQSEQRVKDAASSRKTIECLQFSKQDLESRLNELIQGIDRRETSIDELKKRLLQNEKKMVEIRKERDGLEIAEFEARDQLETVKIEYEEAAVREIELLDTRIRNKESLHKEQLDTTLSELQATLKKLQDSERLLAERGCRLGEMVDHNRDIELELERERTERGKIEDKFVKEQNNLETARADLKKVRAELRKKESVLDCKLKEERSQKEYAEETLLIVKTKYKEAMKTKRNVTELERENGELKDKIRRQEAYLQRKLQKEKTDRARSTPTKKTGSPGNTVPRTPRTTTSSSKILPPSSAYSRSRLQARGASTGIPSATKGRSKISPSVASSRSVRSVRSINTRTTLLQTPAKPTSPLSAQDILQSELDDDRSSTSELCLSLSKDC